MKIYSIGELARCARREVRQRKRVYWRLVQEGRMEAGEMEREIGMMEAIARKLEEEEAPRLI